MMRARKAPAAATVLRSLQTGDFWHYQVIGKVTRPRSASSLALRGTIVVTVVADTLVAHPNSVMLTFVQTLQAETDDGALKLFPAPDLAFSFVQDTVTKDAAILADNMGPNGACRRAATPQVFYPGHWFPGTRYDNRLDFGGGDFVHNTLLVTGAVTIETPLGVREAWVAEITSEGPVMGKITGIDWWTPDLGAPACFETSATLPDGATTSIHAMLTQTNVITGLAHRGERERA